MRPVQTRVRNDRANSLFAVGHAAKTALRKISLPSLDGRLGSDILRLPIAIETRLEVERGSTRLTRKVLFIPPR